MLAVDDENAGGDDDQRFDQQHAGGRDIIEHEVGEPHCRTMDEYSNGATVEHPHGGSFPSERSVQRREAGGDEVQLWSEIEHVPAEGTVNSGKTEAVIEK